LKKTCQSFAPPKISPSRIARPQNLKKHLVKKEGRGGAGRRGQKQESQPAAKTRRYYGLANTTKNQYHHSCISDCKTAQEKELGFHEAQLLKKELHHHSRISNYKITEENMHKNVHERHMRRHMMETFCMNFWKPKKTIAKVIQASSSSSSSSYCEELKKSIELLLLVKVFLCTLRS
jgi:hypothetical protein